MLNERQQFSEEALAPALLLTVFASLALCMPPHNDTWWHLRLGREMTQQGGILLTEQLSHTAAGTPLFHNHEWLTQFLFYTLFSLGGPFLLTLGCAACVIAGIVGAWRLVVGSADVRFVGLALLLALTTLGWAVRPQAISVALFVLALYLATSDRDRWLPLLCVVWSNLHAVAIAGVIIAGCAALDAMLVARHRTRRSLVIFAACAMAPLLTPVGWHYWPRAVQVVRTVRELGIDEYRSAFQVDGIAFLACVATFLALLATSRTPWAISRRTRVLALVAGVFAVAGLLSVRNVPLFMLAAVPAMSRLLPEGRPRLTHRPMPVAAWVILGTVVTFAASGVAIAWRGGGARLGWAPMSAGAIEATRNCRGSLFNGFAAGGPLTWFVPDRPVFVDSRGVEAYPVSLLLRSRAADLTGDYRQLFDEFDIGCAVVESNSVMARALTREPRMRTTYADGQWRVFERKD